MLLASHAEGLICLSGCVLGPLSSRWIYGQQTQAFELADQLQHIFKENFYIELMPAPMKNNVQPTKVVLKSPTY